MTFFFARLFLAVRVMSKISQAQRALCMCSYKYFDEIRCLRGLCFIRTSVL